LFLSVRYDFCLLEARFSGRYVCPFSPPPGWFIPLPLPSPPFFFSLFLIIDLSSPVFPLRYFYPVSGVSPPRLQSFFFFCLDVGTSPQESLFFYLTFFSSLFSHFRRPPLISFVHCPSQMLPCFFFQVFFFFPSASTSVPAKCCGHLVFFCPFAFLSSQMIDSLFFALHQFTCLANASSSSPTHFFFSAVLLVGFFDTSYFFTPLTFLSFVSNGSWFSHCPPCFLFLLFPFPLRVVFFLEISFLRTILSRPILSPTLNAFPSSARLFILTFDLHRPSPPCSIPSGFSCF